EDHGRDADAAADQDGAGALGVEDEGLADGADDADGFAGFAGGEGVQAGAQDFVEDFDPAGLGVGAHDGERPAHGNGGVAGEVYEAAGLGTGGAGGGCQTQDELIAVVCCLFDYARVFEVQRAAGFAGHAAPAAEANTSWRTAMRTATPLRT